MKILVVGGTGPIGSHIAYHFTELGHDVTISARKPPAPASAISDYTFLKGDYVNKTFMPEDLAPFDTIVFAAGQDVRHIPEGADPDAYWETANVQAAPAFAELAKSAGVKNFINIGSFYPQIDADLINTNSYVKSRHLSDKAICKLSDDSFHALSLNAPFVVGAAPGVRSLMFDYYTMYAQGIIPDLPAFGPKGGTNFISTKSLAQAVEGAIENGEGGKSYLVGDENLTFAEYFQLFFDAAGNPDKVVELDQEHAMLPDSTIFTGRGTYVSYEPDPVETALLGYERNDIARAVNDLVSDIVDWPFGK